MSSPGFRPANEAAIFAVGDIHGCLDRLVRLVERLPFDPDKDTLVFLGDYINRGPDSRGVLDFLLDLEKRCAHTIFLLGNHERALLRYARTGSPDELVLLRAMGVDATLSSYGDKTPRALLDLAFMPASHRDFIEKLRPYWLDGDFLFVHAGLSPDKRVEECSLDELTEVREIFLSHIGPGRPVVVFGHTPFETPLVMQDKIGIDTGAASGNMLTAVMLPARRFFHV